MSAPENSCPYSLLVDEFKVDKSMQSNWLFLQVTTFGKNRPLSFINENLIKAESFLTKLKDPNKLRSLEALAESHKIIEWIRRETPKGSSEYDLS